MAAFSCFAGPFFVSRRRAFSERGWLAHYRELIGAWTRRSPAPQDAEDAAQDVALNLLQRGETGVLDSKAYLFGASHLRLKSEWRRQQRRDLVALQHLPDEALPAPDDPQGDLRASQLAQALRDALAELSPACRQVFLWNRLEGYTQAEIARKLGLSQSMVEKHMKRALSHLHERLQAYAPH